MQTKVNWLDQSLFNGPRLAMVTTQKQMDAVTAEINVDSTTPFEDHGDATTTTYHDQQGRLVCVVGVNMEKMAARDPVEAACILVHEAVHVWQQTRAAIVNILYPRDVCGGLAAEMEAYAVQCIAYQLMSAYKELLCLDLSQS